ncbi:polyketide synthase PksD [Hypomontagnella monticulosa]|nr:polyketide synthase PksD [Hypomontagnella monticulosa]
MNPTYAESIAIIGASFKLPQGAEDETSFWDILKDGRNVMTPWPETRANMSTFYKPGTGLKNVLSSKGGHFVREDPAIFDAPFFSITTKEAASMDPQQRWLLETSFRALENAGIPVEAAAGTETGVFAASMCDDYLRITGKDPDEAPVNLATGTSAAMLANRLSWYFDLKGPSMEINTACSSSMVAMDLACQSLRSKQCSMALVTGSNVLLTPEVSVYLSSMNFLSPDSLCYSFDHRANGYARGEGVVVLVLKMLQDAIRDGDMIRAVVRATGTNQDGATPGITQPSQSAQEELIRKVYKSSALTFDSTRYIEAHGTGTQIGDLTEMRALGRVFRSSRSSKDPLYIGSVKANIGHTEGVSGLASILKCIFILERGVIPPNALFEKLNPKINAKQNNFQIPTVCTPWPTPGSRRVSVNSFGFGGSNGHIVMDDAFHTLEALGQRGKHNTTANTLSHGSFTPLYVTAGHGTSNIDRATANDASAIGSTNLESSTHGSVANGIADESMSKTNHVTSSQTVGATLQYQLLVWSAKDLPALQRMVQQYSRYYETSIDGCGRRRLHQLAYTLAARRSVMAWKTYTVLSRSESDKGTSFTAATGVRSSRKRGMALIFTGQGAQYAGMGSALLQYSTFRSTLATADNILQSLGAQWSVFDKLRCSESIHSPEFSQPLCTVLQIALVELLRSFGIVLDAAVGHSSGEIAAAYAIGALSIESACKIAYHRGRVAQQVLRESTSKPSAMMSVNLSERDVDKYLAKSSLTADIHIACVNSPVNVTLSGPESALDMIGNDLQQDNIFAKKLNTGVAYHSPAMQNVAKEYLSLLDSLEPPSQDVRNTAVMISSVTGQRIAPATLLDGQYWVENLTSPVRFADALQYLVTAATKIDNLETMTDYVEVGPHGALRRPLTDTLKDAIPGKGFRYTSVLSRFDTTLKPTLELVGKLFVHGYPVSVTAANVSNVDLPFLVDTPQYPFDRTQSYWHETRLSTDWRLREDVPRSLLGVRSTDWNALEPRWRKQIRIEEMPWVADHVVGKSVFYPAAGMIMMALAAVREMADKRQSLRAYNIKECTFKSPIVVRPEGSTEVMIHLRPLRESYEKSARRFEVRMYTNDEQWKDCFQATCHVEYEDVSTEVDGGHEARSDAANLVRKYEHARATSSTYIETENFYRWLSIQGLKYGPAFSIARNVCWDGDQIAVGCVRIDSREAISGDIAHPAVLDAALQVAFTGPSKGMTRSLPTFIPHRMTDMWISAHDWTDPSSNEIRVLADSRLEDLEAGVRGSLIVLSDNGSPLCRIGSFELLPIMRNDPEDQADIKKIYEIDWQPQLSLLSSNQLRHWCGVDEDVVAEENESFGFLTRLERVLQSVLYANAEHLQQASSSTTPPYLANYVASMQRYLQGFSLSEAKSYDASSVKKELAVLGADNPFLTIYMESVENFVPFIQGDTKFLESLEVTANEYEEQLVSHLFDRGLGSYLELAAHETPNQKILELGPGADALTAKVLSTFKTVESRSGGIAFLEYVHAGAIRGRFGDSRSAFTEYQNRMAFVDLDLERGTSGQKLASGAYDLVIARGVLHSRNATSTLQDICRVLKPSGKVVFIEHLPCKSFITDFAFGMLPGGWKREEDWCTCDPTTMKVDWDSQLKETGFSGCDLVIEGHATGAPHCATAIVCKVLCPPKVPSKASKVLVLAEDDSDFLLSITSALERKLANSSAWQTHTTTTKQLEIGNLDWQDYMIYVADSRSSLLARPTPAEFELIKGLLQRSRSLLWVTVTPSSTMTDSDPILDVYGGIKDGLLRTLRAEYSNHRLVSLSFEGRSHDLASCVDNILQVFHSVFVQGSSEVEYMVRNGTVMVGRLVENADIRHELVSPRFPEIVNEAWLPGPPLKLDIGNRGQLETLCFNEDKDYYADLGPTEVEIEAKGWAVNFRDVFYALGRLKDGSFGTDCAGIVTRVGPECKSIKPGDRVAMAFTKCMRAYVRSDEWAVVHIPDSISFEEACAVMNPTYTAWQCLIEVARLKKGEKILIHSASGATGQLAIQIAQMIGAEVFATVGYEHKKQLLMSLYGIPASHIFYSRNLSFRQGVLRITNGYGVDVVLNSLVGESLIASWECLAPCGRFIEIGKADIEANSVLPMGRFVNNKTFAAVDLLQIVLHQKEMARELIHKAMQLASAGTVQYPRPLRTYDVCDIEDAFRYIQSGRNSGRVVIRVDSSIKVQKHLVLRKEWTFDENATYIIAGGLGGIGRRIIRWMAFKGARNLLILSRSGVSSRAASETVEKLTEQGITIMTPKCDISSLNLLSSTLEECGKNMPPIRGCINATMVLNDSIFENMNKTQWDRTIRSKVQSSWNLHEMLPELDFFILLSSISGVVGNPGQSNYAAGCTFQDALARYRSKRGQKAISIDLGVMRSIGVVAESESLQRHFEELQGFAQLEEEDLISLMDVCCNPTRPVTSNQIIMGLVTPADLLVRSLEPTEMIQQPLYAKFRQARDIFLSLGSMSGASPGELFKKLDTMEDRAAIVVQSLSKKLARALSIETKDVDAEQPLHALGVDSLVAVELRNWIGREFAADVAVFEIMGGRTVKDIGELVSRIAVKGS